MLRLGATTPSQSRFPCSRAICWVVFNLLATILAAECLVLAAIPHTSSFLGPLAPLGIVTYAVFIGLGYSRLKAQSEPLPFRALPFLFHLTLIIGILGGNVAALRVTALQSSHAAHLLWRCSLFAAVILLALACIPFETWVSTFQRTRRLWLYAALAGLAAWCLRYPMQSFWDASASTPGRMLQVLAFYSVKLVLRFFMPEAIVDAATFTVGTPRFAVIIAEACSGMEGLGLVLVFTAVWLWYFRKESRFPQALLLIPCALVSVWVLNILRISALVFIGNAGAPEIAMVGFHSQAGWIAFTAPLPLLFQWRLESCHGCAESRAGLSREYPPQPPSRIGIPLSTRWKKPVNPPPLPNTWCLFWPSLQVHLSRNRRRAILNGSTRSASSPPPSRSGFISLITKSSNWSFGWLAPITGFVIFLVWIVPDLWIKNSPAPSPLANSLAALSPLARNSWMAFRVAAAIFTVPIAEELAFRGYLLRRIIHRDFDQVPFNAMTILSVVLSSIAFGVMHGQHWYRRYSCRTRFRRSVAPAGTHRRRGNRPRHQQFVPRSLGPASPRLVAVVNHVLCAEIGQARFLN